MLNSYSRGGPSNKVHRHQYWYGVTSPDLDRGARFEGTLDLTVGI
jgi:hypothetical protein